MTVPVGVPDEAVTVAVKVMGFWMKAGLRLEEMVVAVEMVVALTI